jgi:hypothetical protein
MERGYGCVRRCPRAGWPDSADGLDILETVDEIFRGTNHEESVSAAAAVVDELARHALVVVSSHNLVLGSLLAQQRIDVDVNSGSEHFFDQLPQNVL